MSRPLLAVLAASLTLASGAWADAHPASTGLRTDGSSAASPHPAPGSPGTPEATRVASGLDAATNLAFGPDGSLYFGEWKTGAVYKVGRDGRPGSYGAPVLDVGEPAWGNERGFVGLAVAADGSFFTFTTLARADGSWFNRLSRWTDGEERLLLDELPAGDWHNGGRIEVDPRDGTIWVGLGDVNARMAAQDPADLRGKILHMDRDGNPVPGNLAPESRAWSLGHRQPFGFAVDAATGRVMVAENMDLQNDEVSLVEAGKNYGWPHCEGPCPEPRDGLVDPVVVYPRTIGPTSGAFFHGDFYFGDFNTGSLHRVFEAGGTWYDEIVHVREPPILDLEPGPEGNTLYFSTWSEIWKLTFPHPRNVTEALPPPEPVGPPGFLGTVPGAGPIGVLASLAVAVLARGPLRRRAGRWTSSPQTL